MNNQEILDRAPKAEGCAVDVAVNTKKSEIMYIKRNARGDKIYRKGKGWNYLQGTLGTHWKIRSLADIERTAELEESVSILQQQIEKMLYNQPAHNLEQKADICELLAETTYTDTAHGINEQFRLYHMAESLRERARQLKDKR
jgi:hypothetical protein